MSVTAARGFRAAGVAAGLKSSGDRDVAVVVNDGPSAAVAAVFTANRVQAAPVRWSRQVVRGGAARGVVLNSGGANACTGVDGFADAHQTAEYVAAALGIGAGEVVVASTGLIGTRLNLPALLHGVDDAVARLSNDGGSEAAIALMTTDTVPKQSALTSGAGVTVGGMAKGAGMLAPSLATMLVVLTTDADLIPTDLETALRAATSATFDRLDSDGCMSTNDTVVLLSSGASGVRPDLDSFTAHLQHVCRDLVLQLVDDAEGASKVIVLEVVGAADEDDALLVGRALARCALLKCAVHGQDPNWGRVLAQVGTTSAVFEPDELSVAINGVWVCRDGTAGESRDDVDMSGRTVTITVDLGAGVAQATVWTNDLTADYVHENSVYSS